MSTALDATALIYALERVARRDHERVDCEQVHDYIRWLREAQRKEIIIPAPAFAEFLAFYGDDDRISRMADVMKRGFRVVETDFRAAALAAEIWVKAGAKEFRRKMAQDYDISKQCVKTDILIVGTALAHGASQIITVDNGVAVVAGLQKLKVLRPEDCQESMSKEAEEIKAAVKTDPKKSSANSLLSMLEEREPPAAS
jgi:predicted nucleic acid-binding protein